MRLRWAVSEILALSAQYGLWSADKAGLHCGVAVNSPWQAQRETGAPG